MSENIENRNNQKAERGGKLSRREVLKGLATVPVVGAFFYGLYMEFYREACP